MRKDPKIFLTHILESIKEIEKYVKDLSEESFLGDTKTQDAIIRRIEIIGEAAKNIPLSFRKEYKNIPWKKMTGTRDVLIHEYFGVNKKLVWKVAKKDIPKLKKQISVLLRNTQPTLKL